MKRIIVVRRAHDYMAFLQGRTDIWGCGKSHAAAIGDLVRTHSEHFGICVTLKDES